MNIKQCLLAAALGAVLSGSVAAASLSAAQAEDLLMRRGFSDISMLQYDNGYWLATAVDENGVLVDVRIDPVDERVTAKRNTRTRTVTTTTTTTTPAPQPVRIVEERPVVVEKVVERPVVVERIIEQPVVRTPVVVQERVLVPTGGKISKDVVQAVLASSGYHNIHDIDWLSNRGVWKAEARDQYGDDREIHVDPYDGRILHVEND